MATVKLGRVSFVIKGEWSNSATYKKLDVVYKNGGSYVAKGNVAAGTAVTNTTYWQPLTGSGYTAAVQSGYTGTEQQWMELVTELDSRVTALNSALDDIVQVSDTQPSSEYNIVWIPDTATEVSVATSAELNTVASDVGTKSNLTTTAKTNLVSAINEVDADVQLL